MTSIVRSRKRVLLVIAGWAIVMVIVSGIAHYAGTAWYTLHDDECRRGVPGMVNCTVCVAERGVQGMVCTAQ